jgi:hypothetical protein
MSSSAIELSDFLREGRYDTRIEGVIAHREEISDYREAKSSIKRNLTTDGSQWLTVT